MKYLIIACICSLLMLVIVLPLLAYAGMWLKFMTLDLQYVTLDYEYDAARLSLLETAGYAAGIFITPIAAGWLFARYMPLPPACFSRYWPLIAPPAFCCLLSALIIPLLLAIPVELAAHIALLCLLYLLYLLGFALSAHRRQPALCIKKGLLQLSACMIAALSPAGLITWQIKSNILPAVDPAIESIGHGVDVYEYLPFAADNKLVVPDTPPSLSITENHPRLDGAIALLPVYGAAAQAVYAGLSTQDYGEYQDDPAPKLPHIGDLVECNNTSYAWERLVSGKTDIFFGAPPSERQLRLASVNELEPEITPIAKDAFVFMVNIHNPVDSLTVEQIRDIYRKKITNWEDVGGADEKILAFQRPEGSGSQTAMTEQVMAGLTLAKPLQEESIAGMGDIINAVAEFRNRKEAIGYTFRWYSQVQFPSDQIKLLAINGVPPLPENIADNTYPFAGSFVAVTLRPRSPETQALLDWLLGPEGQALIRKTGYVPLHPD